MSTLGTKDNPWKLKTPPQTSEYEMYLDVPAAGRVAGCDGRQDTGIVQRHHLRLSRAIVAEIKIWKSVVSGGVVVGISGRGKIGGLLIVETVSVGVDGESIQLREPGVTCRPRNGEGEV